VLLKLLNEQLKPSLFSLVIHVADYAYCLLVIMNTAALPLVTLSILRHSTPEVGHVTRRVTLGAPLSLTMNRGQKVSKPVNDPVCLITFYKITLELDCFFVVVLMSQKNGGGGVNFE
jgi:hypothetical protein